MGAGRLPPINYFLLIAVFERVAGEIYSDSQTSWLDGWCVCRVLKVGICALLDRAKCGIDD